MFVTNVEISRFAVTSDLGFSQKNKPYFNRKRHLHSNSKMVLGSGLWQQKHILTCSLLSQEAQSWRGGRCLKETEKGGGGRAEEAGGAAQGDFWNILIQRLYFFRG